MNGSNTVSGNGWTGGNVYRTQRNLQLAEKLLKEMNDLSKQDYDLVMKQLKQIGDKKALNEATIEMRSAFDLAKKYEGKTLEFEGIATGMPLLDGYLLGLKPGDVVIVGAYTGLGKSTVTADWCLNFAKQGVNCCMFFMEDSEYEAGTRLSRLAIGRQENRENYKGKFYYYPMEYKDAFYRDKFAFIPAVEAIVLARNIQVICLDMLNDLVDPINDRDADDFMVELKSMADRLGIVLITTARLREPKAATRTGKWFEKYKPNEDAIYGRSMIKYLATKIITISRVPNRPLIPATGLGTPERQYLGFHVMKNRMGFNTNQTFDVLVYELQRGRDYMKINEVGVDTVGGEDADEE